MAVVDEVVKKTAGAANAVTGNNKGTNYDINYNDPRFTQVNKDKNAALSEVDKTYGSMINSSDKYYQDQINASKQWAETQKKNQQAQTDFAIQEINQQKAQAKKDYTTEQSAAYVDWQQQSNQYGVNAEQMAASGMRNTGYSESSQVSMYNTYQYRVTAARESYQLAVQNYNNAITEARLQNNSILAEIAYEAQKQQLELSLAGFQYKNQLILEKANQKQAVENNYYNRYQDVLQQINQENALAEEVRQYNASLAEEKRQYNANLALNKEQLQLQKDQFAWQKAQAAKSSSSGGSSGGSIKKSSSKKSSGRKTSSAKGGTISEARVQGGSSSSSKKSSSPTVDMSSVMALGYGPISASRLNQLIKEGKVKEYEDNGKLKYKKVFNY